MTHTVPSVATLKARHPRFDALADATVLLYIEEASRTVTTAWTEADYADGIMYLAAHLMVMEGALAPTGIAMGVGNQLKKVKAGEVEAEFAAEKANDGVGGQLWATYGRTFYGQRFLDLAARNGGQSEAAVAIA